MAQLATFTSPEGGFLIYYSRNYCKITQNKSIKQIAIMIIGKDTEYQTLEESIDYDIANALDSYNNGWHNKVTELKRAQREEEESRWHGFKDIRTEYGEIYYNGMVIDEEDFEDFAWDIYCAEAEDNDECPCQEYFEHNLKPEWFKTVLDKYCATLNQ